MGINRVINRRLSRLFRYFLKKAFLLFLFFPFMFRMKLVFFVGIVLSAESFPQIQQGKAVQNARQEMEAGGWTALRTRQNALSFPLQELKEVKAQADLIQDDKENQGDVEKQDEKESSNKFLATKFGEKMLDNLEEALNAYRQNDNSKPTKKREAAFISLAIFILSLTAAVGSFGVAAAADGKGLDVRTEQDLSELRLNGA